MLQFYSASNGLINSKQAIEACLSDATNGEVNYSAINLIVIHSTIGHDFQLILNTAQEFCPNAKIIGCSCAGVIGKEGANENLKALAIMIVTTDDHSELAASSCAHINGTTSFERGREMALAIKKQQQGTNILQLYTTGIDIACDQLIAGIESVFGSDVPIIGGTASDNMRAERTYQFSGAAIHEHGGVLVGYADSSLQCHTAVHHGFSPIGTGYTVTRSENNRIYEIENEPAWPFLMSKLGLPPDQHPGPCIPIAGIGELLPPDMQLSYHNKHILRVITKVDHEDGSFYFPTDCPVGGKIWFSERDETLIFAGLDQMLMELETNLGSSQLVAVYHTDCAARGRALFDRILKEEIIHRMQHPLFKGKPHPWLGMYGFGEFTPLANQNLFHNYTTSIYALTRSKA